MLAAPNKTVDAIGRSPDISNLRVGETEFAVSGVVVPSEFPPATTAGASNRVNNKRPARDGPPAGIELLVKMLRGAAYFCATDRLARPA